MHIQKFNEVFDSMLDKIKLQTRVLELTKSNSCKAFNAIDDVLTETLNEARAAIEGPKRTLPHSQCKLERSNQCLHWQLRVKKL